MSEIVNALKPVLKLLKSLGLNDTEAVKAALDKDFSLDSEFGTNLRKLADAGLEDGSLCKREAGPTKFSRVAKPDDAEGFSIDAVSMWGDGPAHVHPEGEVNAMFAIDGEPEFCGVKPGWAVYAPGSQHIPSVKGGKMMIFYMLPNGAVEWK